MLSAGTLALYLMSATPVTYRHYGLCCTGLLYCRCVCEGRRTGRHPRGVCYPTFPGRVFWGT
jgi:hypothetical protein